MNSSWHLCGTGLESLRLRETALPEPAPGEVIVRMRAAAINQRDLGIMGGAYPNKPDLIPLSDGAGTIAALGAGVTGWHEGDAVITSFYPFWENGPTNAASLRASLGCEMDGVLAHYARVPASALVAKPRTLTHGQASTLPCAGLTAWSALFTEGSLRPGETVLVQGTGGVALFALQLAKMAGARVIILSGDEAKIERARQLGADITINYRATPAWASGVLDATEGQGADLIVELGGQTTLPQSLACVKVGGRISVIGVLSGLEASIPVPQILFRHIHLTGITVGHRTDLAALCAAVDGHALTPVIYGTFAFTEAPAAYRALMQAQHMGKLVVEIADADGRD